MWELAAAVDGWRRANAPEEEQLKPPTDDEFKELLAKSRVH